MPRISCRGSVQKFRQDLLGPEREQRYGSVLIQLPWAALSCADLRFQFCFLSKFHAKQDPSVERGMCVVHEMVVDSYSPCSNNARDVPDLSSAETEMIDCFDTAKEIVSVGMLSGFPWTS